MAFRILFIILFSLTLISCSAFKTTFSTVPIPIAAFSSPLTIDLGNLSEPINNKMSSFDKCRLLEISSDPDSFSQRTHCKNNDKTDDAIKIADLGFDNFDDLCNTSDDALLFVAISGGGARATALATHTMASLEKKYNTLNWEALAKGEIAPLIDRIHVISSVSGGSIYAYQVARLKLLLDTDKLQHVENTKMVSSLNPYDLNRSVFFQILEKFPLKGHEQGLYSAMWYLSPFNLFVGPILTTFTNVDYLDVLSGGLNGLSFLNEKKISKEEKNLHFEDYLKLYLPALMKLSEIPATPRIFFNSTNLETGLPFVFTQRYVNLPNKKEFIRTVRHDLHDENGNKNVALQTASTLEEINSTPKKMPLAYAAMASAAFPLGLQPLRLIKYGYRPVQQELYETSERIHVSDGGIYDNSGLSAITDLVLHLSARKDIKQNDKCNLDNLVILSINADADEYDLFYPHKIAQESSFLQKQPFSLNFPLRVGVLGVESLNLIHFVNKRRAEQIAIKAITDIRDEREKKETRGKFTYFPVSLSQLSSFEKYKINDPSNLYEKLKKIGTNYVISDDDDLLLEHAAHLLLTSNQPAGASWGLESKFCQNEQKDNRRLEDIFVFALNPQKHCNGSPPELLSK
ncbi:hypothetical protein Nit79A3_0531 [Nitrosomonas sp. Is79A3]